MKVVGVMFMSVHFLNLSVIERSIHDLEENNGEEEKPLHFKTLVVCNSKRELEKIMKNVCDDYGQNPIPRARVKCDYWTIEQELTLGDIDEIVGNYYYLVLNGRFYGRMTHREQRELNRIVFSDRQNDTREKIDSLNEKSYLGFAVRIKRLLKNKGKDQKVFILDLHN